MLKRQTRITDRLDELSIKTRQDLEAASDATKALLLIRLCEYFHPHGDADPVVDLVLDAGTNIAPNDQYAAIKYRDGSVLYVDACGDATALNEQAYALAVGN